MKIIYFGDMVGRPGRNSARDALRTLSQDFAPDLAFANAENASGGIGLTIQTAEELLATGLDGLSSGNHIWRHREIYDYLDGEKRLVRPANYPKGAPGKGLTILKDTTGQDLALINLLGRTFMEPVDCPFQVVEQLLDDLDNGIRHIVVDFHAEATSEKQTMLHFLDGRVSAVLGTHTHVQTNDAMVSQKGTAYITDLGMCGVRHSVLGMDARIILRRTTSRLPERFQPAKGKAGASGVLLELGDDGRALDIKAFNT